MNGKIKQNLNILITGVGGMGVISTANIIKDFLMGHNNNYHIRTSESRGVAQREGSVYAYIRVYHLINNKKNKNDYKNNHINNNDKREQKKEEIYLPPQPPIHKCDLILALEPLELIRSIEFFHDKSVIILNTRKNIPKSSLNPNKTQYPNIDLKLKEIKEIFKNLIVDDRDFIELANKSGKPSIMANKFMLYEIPKHFPNYFPQKKFIQYLEKF